MIVWIIGLSGSGKTTIGRELFKRYKESRPATVLIDGDEIRKIFNHDKTPDAYTIAGRKKNSERIFQLCAWLDRQNINVICCILSIFPEHRKRNRKEFSSYKEIFLEAPLEILQKRRTLYSDAFEGKTKNVVGVDIPFEKPIDSDMSFNTSNSDLSVTAIANQIIDDLI